MNAAQPFMLIVVQMGNTKCATLGEMPNLSVAVCKVTGSVAAELLVKRAISTAGIILPSVRMGLMPRTKRKSGRTMKNCTTLPPSITATYLPSDSITMPAENCAVSCAAKATMPSGKAHISPRIRSESRSCIPKSAFISTSFFPDCGILAKAMPAAADRSSTDSTLPSENAFTTLLGITPRMWS